jgi:HD-GYP domain-containing protein (c-di-GMP phosphodiesterase class II)
MTTDRSYRRALPVADAVAELERCAGTQFDPAVVEALIEVAVAPREPDWQLTLSEPEPEPEPEPDAAPPPRPARASAAPGA